MAILASILEGIYRKQDSQLALLRKTDKSNTYMKFDRNIVTND